MSNTAAARQKMVDSQVRTADVTDLRLIEALREIPREAFLPESQKALAYLDIDIALDGAPDVYLIKPVVLARMVQAAEIGSGDRVLVTGGAAGYAAAIVAKLAAEVVAVVGNSSVAELTRTGLSDAGVSNVTVSVGEAAAGDASKGPYDIIVLDGATEVVPEGLYQQLQMDGRLVGVFALSKPSRATLVTKSPGDFGGRTLFDASAPVLSGLKRLPAFSF
ncbi:MAG: protein-L-isoaspartate O-methyltransferase [Xanthobacteraceae bacterium]|nr:protein-L-isoaspartate O-methyltransferase [Xanthobacteraceae bacterium]